MAMKKIRFLFISLLIANPIFSYADQKFSFDEPVGIAYESITTLEHKLNVTAVADPSDSKRILNEIHSGMERNSTRRAHAAAFHTAKVGLDLYKTNTLYKAGAFPIPSNVPSNAYITAITWNWSVVNYQSGLKVYLCTVQYSSTGCIDVSLAASSGTYLFNLLPASTTEFRLHFFHPSYPSNQSVNINPVMWKQSNSMIVTYQY